MADKTLLENGKVKVVTTKEIDRYEGRMYYSQAECELVTEDFKEMNKIWTTKRSREGFECLDTKEDWEPEGESLQDDMASFQKYLDDTYGKDKYEVYALGAYIHSTVSFAFNKGEDTRCKWDSGTIGFVGINKELHVDLNAYASNLSDAWNGWIYIMEVWDNFDDEVVDDIISLESTKDINAWKESMKEKYGVTEYIECN